jgi:hypothetical protein
MYGIHPTLCITLQPIVILRHCHTVENESYDPQEMVLPHVDSSPLDTIQLGVLLLHVRRVSDQGTTAVLILVVGSCKPQTSQQGYNSIEGYSRAED